jgi:hypothetical protein
MLKVSVIVLTVMLAFAGLYAVLLIASPATIADGTLQARAGIALASVPDKGTVETILVQTRHVGVMALSVTIASFFVLFAGFAKKVRWAWYCVLVVGLIVWGYGLVVQALEGDIFNMIMHLVGIVLLAVGVLLPVKQFFGKGAE